MPVWFQGRHLGFHPSALRHKTEEDIERALRTNFRADTEGAHGRQDIAAVAGRDMKGLPTVVLDQYPPRTIFHANKPCDEFLYMFT